MEKIHTYDEKRNFIRMRLNAVIRFTVANQDKVYEGKCKNISGNGVLIETNTSFEPGTHLDIVIPSESTEIDDLQAVAEIVRVKSLGAEKFELATEMKQIKP